MDSISLFPSFGGFALNTFAFVVALSIIVSVHEYGHYIVGRWSGIHAEVFSLGFGPVLYSRVDKRGTKWQIAAIPLGGYVKFLGDADAASGAADVETLQKLSVAERRHTLHGAPLWARASTVAAGPVFNFILSTIIFFGVLLSVGVATTVPTIGSISPMPGGPMGLLPGDEIVAVEGTATPDQKALAKASETLPDTVMLNYTIRRDGAELIVPGPALFPARVNWVQPDSAAESAGLQAGDVIMAVDGTPVYAFLALQKIVASSDGKPLSLTIWRNGNALPDMVLTPKRLDIAKPDGGFEKRWLVGVSGNYFFEPETRRAGPIEALKEAAHQTWSVGERSLSGLWHIATGRIDLCNMRGPIGIAESSGAAAAQGFIDFIWFIGVLSTAIGLLNLFPIPVLDGGHLLFHAYEWAVGRPPAPKILNFVTLIGLVVVLSLMVLGLTNDLRC